MGNFLVGMVNGLIKALGAVIGLITSLLPPSPFGLIDNSSVSTFINGIGWVIPVSQILAILQAWLVAVGLYYIVQIVLRWVKAIE